MDYASAMQAREEGWTIADEDVSLETALLMIMIDN